MFESNPPDPGTSPAVYDGMDPMVQSLTCCNGGLVKFTAVHVFSVHQSNFTIQFYSE